MNFLGNWMKTNITSPPKLHEPSHSG
jgi:hypothetical protein